ncbi:hypothetical protein HKX48_008756 [Thoreauomyces humboldtii]|nr:hypothetical protein HKX48_008756 [Thoreauomyces humboldtii]
MTRPAAIAVLAALAAHDGATTTITITHLLVSHHGARDQKVAKVWIARAVKDRLVRRNAGRLVVLPAVALANVDLAADVEGDYEEEESVRGSEMSAEAVRGTRRRPWTDPRIHVLPSTTRVTRTSDERNARGDNIWGA